ncbi:ATP-dependent Clp protease ATP-binding subunit [bacterium]|nr:ATP-dependent Clp protease ATP-binding subunit [bacterium]
MKVRIPIYMQGSTDPPKYLARPLFWPDKWYVESPLLQKVIQLAQQTTSQSLEEARRDARLEELTRLTFCPDLREHFLQIRFEFEKRTAQVRLLLVSFTALGQSIVYSPTLSDLWFPFKDGPMEMQAAEALRQLLRQQKRDGLEVDPDKLSVSGRAWIHYYESDLAAPGVVSPPAKKSLLALLGAAPTRSGAEELAQVGRDLQRRTRESPEVFLGRERELAELASWNQQETRTGILIVGPRLVGKSALIRAHVARLQQARALAETTRQRKTQKMRRGTWLLSPGRLISGMSYLGQWENRLLNILRHCRKHDHVVVFDDMLGLLTAGVSRDSSLNVAQLLKSFLDRGDLRVLAEITPEAYQILRERDQALADHFQVIFLEEPTPQLTRSIALTAARAAEESQACTFSLEAVHNAVQIGDRYLTDCSHPGKVARLIFQVAAHHRQQGVGGGEILQWFSQHSGMSLQLLDSRTPLESRQILEGLRQHMVGQDEAVDCCLQVVHMTKARIQLPNRPLASLLFIGPTGVGKTECAKALARTLFASEDRLIRIDMNEFVGHDSMARLIGTFHRPEGLLTEAVRSQPFSVLLLDEVEKANPQVLLLLLQILGDGRLTDARGRTVDFSQTIVVMTSNLGAENTRRNLGLRHRRHQEELVYRRAAEDFFPPELFNRMDRIVPFHRLDRATVALIAERLWQKLLLREGLRRRQCLLEVDPQARERVVDAGFHPQLGARALKRTVEDKIVGPVARRLAALPPQGLTLIRVDADLEVSVESLAGLASSATAWGKLSENELQQQIDQVERQLQSQLAPADQPLYSQEDLQEEHLLYFELKEELRRLRAALRSTTHKGKPRRDQPPPLRQLSSLEIEKILSSDELSQDLEELGQNLSSLPHLDVELRLSWIRRRLAEPQDEHFELQLSGHPACLKRLTKAYQEAFKSIDLEFKANKHNVELKGPLACRAGQGECGLHLFVEREGFHCVWVQHDQIKPRLVRIYIDTRGCLDLISQLFCRQGWPLTSLMRSR